MKTSDILKNDENLWSFSKDRKIESKFTWK